MSPQTHDITTLADPLVAVDSLTTQDAYTSICRVPPNLHGRDLYTQLPEVRVRLSALRQTFEQQKASRAIARLQQRSTLIIDEDYIIETDDPDYCFSCKKSFLDFILVVGAKKGLAMFIPHVVVDHTFSIDLNLRLHIKQFHAKHGTVGFDTTGAMWCVGQTRSEELWIGMAPNTFFNSEVGTFIKAKDSGDPRLSTRHARIMQTFIIWLLTKLPGRHYELEDPYATDLTGVWQIDSNAL